MNEAATSLSFAARQVSFSTEDGVHTFAAGDTDSPTQRYLLISRSADGSDGIYFERDDQHFSAYDAVASVEFSSSGVHIVLRPEVASQFDGCTDYDVAWELSPEQHRHIAVGLQTLFHGTSILHNRNA